MIWILVIAGTSTLQTYQFAYFASVQCIPIIPVYTGLYHVIPIAAGHSPAFSTHLLSSRSNASLARLFPHPMAPLVARRGSTLLNLSCREVKYLKALPKDPSLRRAEPADCHGISEAWPGQADVDDRTKVRNLGWGAAPPETHDLCGIESYSK